MIPPQVLGGTGRIGYSRPRHLTARSHPFFRTLTSRGRPWMFSLHENLWPGEPPDPRTTSSRPKESPARPGLDPGRPRPNVGSLRRRAAGARRTTRRPFTVSARPELVECHRIGEPVRLNADFGDRTARRIPVHSARVKAGMSSVKTCSTVSRPATPATVRFLRLAFDFPHASIASSVAPSTPAIGSASHRGLPDDSAGAHCSRPPPSAVANPSYALWVHEANEGFRPLDP